MHLKCTKCEDYLVDWIKSTTAVTLPTTLMYLFFVFFRFRATDPVIHEFVIYSQLMMSPLSKYYMYEDIGA